MLLCLLRFLFFIIVSYLFVSFVSVSFSILALWGLVSCCGRLIRFFLGVSYSFCLGWAPCLF